MLKTPLRNKWEKHIKEKQKNKDAGWGKEKKIIEKKQIERKRCNEEQNRQKFQRQSHLLKWGWKDVEGKGCKIKL